MGNGSNIAAENSILSLEDAINDVCPWSGQSISSDALTLYKGHVVGFCNPTCRDKFENAILAFDEILQLATINNPIKSEQ